jgi:hypothetical protein
MRENKQETYKLIKETLTQEEAAFYDHLEEEGLFSSIKGLFKGKLKWVICTMIFMNFIILGFFIYALFQFFEAQEMKEMMQWSLVSFMCILIMSMLKLYFWMQMNKNALLREIKRLELLVTATSVK